MELKLKHLEFIQGVINRLSTNSFLLKGWSVALVSALFALAASEARTTFVFLAFVPAIVFWGLDGFFLRQEKLFRRLYDEVRDMDDGKIDFSMQVSKYESTFGLVGSIFSMTLIPFHGGLLLAIMIVMCFIR